jgi:cation transport ATPase
MSTPPPRRRLPAGAAVLVAVLLLIPCVALALVPTYSRETPKLWGWPFFYWYQVMWVLITPIVTYAAYVVIKRARGDR